MKEKLSISICFFLSLFKPFLFFPFYVVLISFYPSLSVVSIYSNDSTTTTTTLYILLLLLRAHVIQLLFQKEQEGEKTSNVWETDTLHNFIIHKMAWFLSTQIQIQWSTCVGNCMYRVCIMVVCSPTHFCTIDCRNKELLGKYYRLKVFAVICLTRHVCSCF